MTSELLRVALRADRDVVVARQRARDIARHLGLDPQEQIRVATAVSEVARNAVEHGGGGSVQFAVALAPEPELIVRVIDQGPGIPHLDRVLGGLYQSSSGLGIGLIGARRLMDRFRATAPAGGGTTIELGKTLPRMSPAERRRRLADAAEVQVRWGRLRERYGAGGEFLFGAFSLADCCYAPVVTRFETYGVELDPVSRRYCEAMNAVPEVQAWRAAALAEPWRIPHYE